MPAPCADTGWGRWVMPGGCRPVVRRRGVEAADGPGCVVVAGQFADEAAFEGAAEGVGLAGAPAGVLAGLVFVAVQSFDQLDSTQVVWRGRW